jgi:hypothetical protein
LLHEIGLAEGGEGAAASGKRPSRMGQVAAAATGLLAARGAQEITLSGEVILPPGMAVPGARYWHTPQLYGLASAAFRATGQMSRVTVPKTDLAHWTYPLPVKVPGAADTYTLHDLVPLRLPYTTDDPQKDRSTGLHARPPIS